MRIVIDYQGAQSGGSRNRGIGRYTASVTRAIIRSAREAEIILLLNEAFSETIEPIRAEFEGLLPQENILLWRPLRPIGHIQATNDDRRRASELLREAFIARLEPDALLITSHFEGSGDDGATTIGLLPANYPTAIILYDLIPYIYRSIYLSNSDVERWYEDRMGNLKRADLLLAISESSRQEAVDYLGYPDDRALSISTAADEQFKRVELDEAERKALFGKYGITKPFVMYTGGIDHRKNIEGLIRAFGALPAKVRKKHQVAVICSIRSEDGPRLRQIAAEAGLAHDDLILTGFVPEGDLIALYSLCKLFVFPSWHEGFGLPALEAMLCGAPVIAGNRSSLPEVIGDPRALFDPRRDEAISEKMAVALQDEQFRQQLITNGAQRAQLFSWEAIGKRAVSAIKEAIRRRRKEATTDTPGRRRRPRLAMVTPMPPAQSGIAYYAATLIRALQEFYEIDVVLSDGVSTDDPFILANCRIIDAGSFRRSCKDYERVVYQFGNSDHHSHMVDLIAECPGVVVLHDFFVSDLSSWREHLGGVYGNWGNDLYESHGIGALLERYREPDLFSIINKYPCSYSVTRHALGVICHSEEAKSLQLEWHGNEAVGGWTVVPMIRPKPKLPARSDARQALGMGENEFLVCAFGILGKSKLNHRLIEAWISSKLGADKRCRLVFVGGHGPEDYYADLRNEVARQDVAAKVQFSGWVAQATYMQYLAAADVAVQLRGQTHGETSAATLDAMLAGLPVIANVSPSLPKEADHAIAFIPADAPVSALATKLTQLYKQVELRQKIGQAAQKYAAKNHSESICGRRFAQAVEQAYRTSAATFNAGVEELAGIHLSESEAASLADEFAGLLDKRAMLYLDITKLLSGLPETLNETLEPLLSSLAKQQPALRVVAVELVDGRYFSTLHQLMRAAKHPHVHDSEEHVLIRSVDWLAAFDPEQAGPAERMARSAGAKFLAIPQGPECPPSKTAKLILEFVTTSAAGDRSFARHFTTPSLKVAAAAKAPSSRRLQRRRAGKPSGRKQKR
ncbi:MAG TPA: glycosyltransferase [Sphingomicrobium sp.]|nr:glycosyltransferase [Sphingomicrobium sp.]